MEDKKGFIVKILMEGACCREAPAKMIAQAIDDLYNNKPKDVMCKYCKEEHDPRIACHTIPKTK